MRAGPLALAAAFLLLSAAAAAAAPVAAADLLASARQALEAGDTAGALALLRELRSAFPDDPQAVDALQLSVLASLAAGDDLRARYFLDRLAVRFPGSAALFDAAVAMGDRAYGAGDWQVALDAYRIAVAVPTGQRDRDRALVRAAELELHRGGDVEAARGYWRAVGVGNLDTADRELHRRLRVRLAWELLSPLRLGLKDSNISSLTVDGEDLWIGTWNGGAARWSIAAKAADTFPAPASPRGFLAEERRVWVATFDGLYWYARGSGRFAAVDELAGSKVQALAVVGGELYAGTLGDGLRRLRGEAWERVGSDDWPGRFITCLAPWGKRLLVGTMNLGLLVLDPAAGTISGLADQQPAFTPRNVTAVLAGRHGRVWIGTYGDGLWLWDGAGVHRYGRDTGEIGDDWVLAICETDTGVWFGTFGAGASSLGDDGRWRRLGLADGLPSLDVAAIAWRRPWLFLGTLGAGVCGYWEGADGPGP